MKRFAICLLLLLTLLLQPHAANAAEVLKTIEGKVYRVGCFIVIGSQGNSYIASTTSCSFELRNEQGIAGPFTVRASSFPLLPLLQTGDAIEVSISSSGGPFPSERFSSIKRAPINAS